MTEYDYSPAAYDRYMNTQNRVSNWVSQTKAHERQYSNPFVPSTVDSDVTPPHASGPQRSRSRSSGSGAIRTRDINAGPQRSKTIDSRRRDESPPPRSGRGRSFDDIDAPSSRSPHHQPRSRSYHSHSHHTRSRSYGSAHPPMPVPSPSPIRAHTVPADVVYKTVDSVRPVYLPAPRSGQTYVIVPPGRRVEMISSKGNVVYPHPSPHHAHHGGKEPLLKRLLGSITWNGSGGGGGGRERERERARRRTSY